MAGGAAGLAATAPMTVAMKSLHRALPRREQYALPPKQITQRLAGEQAVPSGSDRWGALTYLAHFAYGAAAGAGYAAVFDRLRVHPAAKGVGFGLAVWAGSYLGWLPALGILPAASEEPPGRNGVMIAAHIVWGAATGLIAAGLLKRAKSRRPSRLGLRAGLA